VKDGNVKVKVSTVSLVKVPYIYVKNECGTQNINNKSEYSWGLAYSVYACRGYIWRGYKVPAEVVCLKRLFRLEEVVNAWIDCVCLQRLYTCRGCIPAEVV